MFTDVCGIKTNYTVEGNGDYIFLFHGWGANLTLFKQLAGVLSEKYTVVCLDFPGFGETPEPPEPWDVSAYTMFAASFIKSFNCKSVILLGHSFGGRVIIKLANMKGLTFTIDKIILTDSAGILPKRSLRYKLRLRLYKLGKRFLSFRPVAKCFPNALERYKKKMGSADYSSASEIMRQCLVRVVNEDLTPLLKNISAPTLLIWGDADTATPLSDGQLMEKEIPDAGLVVLKGAGHYSFLDQPYIYSKVIKSFLKIGV